METETDLGHFLPSSEHSDECLALKKDSLKERKSKWVIVPAVPYGAQMYV